MSHEIASKEYQFLRTATELLDDAGFGQRTLSDLNLPKVESHNADGNVLYRTATFGDVADAKGVVFTDMPYSTSLDDASQMVRLAAQKEAIGPDYALVGVETYHPEDLRFNRGQRKQISDGNLKPFSDRFMAAVRGSGVRADQELSFYGFSKPADVATEAAYRNESEITLGDFEVANLGAFDPSRVIGRFPVKVMIDFSQSGKQLWESVLASNSAALLEARGIDPKADPKEAEKNHAKEVNSGVSRYMMADLLGTWALFSGAGHTGTLDQIRDLSKLKKAGYSDIDMVVGYMVGSTITPKAAREEFRGIDGLTVVGLKGVDHAAADNLNLSAAMMLHTIAEDKTVRPKIVRKS